MRKILTILLFACLACESSLDLEPKMFISAEEAFNSRENVHAALIGCYDALQLQHYYGRNFIIVGDLASDNSQASGTKIEYYSADDNSLLADNILVEGIWTDIYSAINRVNYMLYKLDEIQFLTTAEKNDYAGQLRALRALHYFNLVRLYGAIPLKINPTLQADQENYLPRSEPELVYGQIISDLEFSIVHITNHQVHLMTATAAKAILSLVHLTIGNYNEAYEFASEVFNSAGILETEFSELFASSAEPSREILFYVPFQANDKNRLAEYHLPNQLGGRYENSPTGKLVALLEEEDARKELVASSYNEKYYTRKYAELTTGTDKVIVFRAAELLFIMAEAQYHLDSVGFRDPILASVNAIRSRAHLAPVAEPHGNSLWSLIETERQIEFAFEGKRWFDLIRTGRAIGSVSTVTSEDQLLFPIPLSEIEANPSIGPGDQNRGY